jgi:uncharacterized membrane protein
VATTPTPHHDRHKLVRLAIGMAVGAVAATLVPSSDGSWVARALVGFVVAALAFTVPLLWRTLHADVGQTRSYVDGLDPGRSLTDVIVLVASVAALAGVGMMLLDRTTSHAARNYEAVVAVATVGSAWLLIHTMFALRYARHWFNAEADCIDFHMDDEPAYSDFVYLAFAIGSSFAVSDTDLRTTEIRRVALRQSWLSYLFGTVVVAATINLLAGLAA